MESKKSIREFYKGRSVLVTGGTGFMGKVLLEKLLYSIPDIGNIYVIMRPKRGKSIIQRLEDIKRLPLFNRIRSEKPNVLNKLKPMQGDVLFEDLGLSGDEISSLSEEVSVMFHFAATLKLEAPMKDSVNMNTSGTRRALNVAKRLKKLTIFVHLSTAFCYPDYDVLDEKIYPPPMNPDDLMRIVECLNEKQVEMITPSMLGPHPNCYTYSKRMSEMLVGEAHKEMPVCIVRPSIVCPSHIEPLPGWVDNLNGPVGVMLGAGKGVIRTMLCDGSLKTQVIPVDAAINAIVAIGMIEGSKETKSDIIPVYNVTLGEQITMTWGEVLKIAKQYARIYPLSWPLWYPNGDITTNRVLHEMRRVCYHLIPAYFVDFLLVLFFQKPILVRIQNRISQGLEVLQYFTMREWKFPSPNFDSICTKLDETERKMFNTEVGDNDPVEYMRTCVEGGRIYCLKEDPSKIHINKMYHNFLYVMDWIVKIAFWGLIIYWLSGFFF